MTSYCQNGWPVVGRDKIASYRVPGTSVSLPVRRGDVATVLIHVAHRFNNEVQPLKKGWCWGYAVRAVFGKTSGYSNHAGGTAIDLNAPNFPLGSRRMSAAQKRAVRNIMNDLMVDGNQVVRAGAFYNSRPDEMHFEIIGSPTQVAKLAARIRGGKATTASITPPAGVSRTERVKRIQHTLLGPTHGFTPKVIDGHWGPRTDARVGMVRAVARGAKPSASDAAVIGVLIKHWGSWDNVMRRMADSYGSPKAPLNKKQTWGPKLEAAYQQLRKHSLNK